MHYTIALTIALATTTNARGIIAPAPTAPVAQRPPVVVVVPEMATTCHLNHDGTCWSK